MDKTMKTKPFINTLPPKNKVSKAKMARMNVIEILVRTATVFSKPELLPKNIITVGTIRIANKMIFRKSIPLQQGTEVTKEEHTDKIHKVDKQKPENRNQLQAQRAFLGDGKHDDCP